MGSNSGFVYGTDGMFFVWGALTGIDPNINMNVLRSHSKVISLNANLSLTFNSCRVTLVLIGHSFDSLSPNYC